MQKKLNSELPVIDMTPLFNRKNTAASAQVVRAIQTACRDNGFFYVTGHQIPQATLKQLDLASRQFFALPEQEKMKIKMAYGGTAWRGFFPVGNELTSGKPDIKEGLYFGTELPLEHPRVQEGYPLHGSNLWPEQVPHLREAVLQYMAATEQAAHVLMEGIAMSLGLAANYFNQYYTSNPTILFRIFHYPPPIPKAENPIDSWGVGEHTDYGLLTLLAQDQNGGLQVKSKDHWIDAPPLPGTLVCNIGDMLDRLTGGWFRSTAHRVRNDSGQSRLSFPLFFDPDFSAEMRPLPQNSFTNDAASTQSHERWDKADLQDFEGTYGDYLLGKVSKVFPDLIKQVL